MKIRPVGAELFHADGRTDRHDEADSRFWQFCKYAYKQTVYIYIWKQISSTYKQDLTSSHIDSGVTRNFFLGVQQIQLRTEDREDGDLGVVAP